MKKYLLILLGSLLAGCVAPKSGEIEYIVKTEYADIPETFKTVPEIPPIPEKEKITVGEALYTMSELRTALCIYASRYRELYRFGSFGQVVLDLPDEKSCPRVIE